MEQTILRCIKKITKVGSRQKHTGTKLLDELQHKSVRHSMVPISIIMKTHEKEKTGIITRTLLQFGDSIK